MSHELKLLREQELDLNSKTPLWPDVRVVKVVVRLELSVEGKLTEPENPTDPSADRRPS